MQTFKTGDRVAFAAAFLKSIMEVRASVADMRGTVTSLGLEVRPGVHLVNIRWDNPHERATRVLSTNLWPADKIHLEPN